MTRPPPRTRSSTRRPRASASTRGAARTRRVRKAGSLPPSWRCSHARSPRRYAQKSSLVGPDHLAHTQQDRENSEHDSERGDECDKCEHEYLQSWWESALFADQLTKSIVVK